MPPVHAYKNDDGLLLSGDPVDGRIYTICTPMEAFVNNHYRVLDIEQPREYWSNVSTYESTGVDWQEWEFIDYGYYWKIKSLKPDATNNRDNYLSVAADSPYIGANAWVWYNCTGTGQRFKIVNVEGTQYYQFLTACSNYTLALGVDPSTHNVEQMSAVSAYTYFYIVESAANHGAVDGKAYIQEYLSSYSATGAKFLSRSTANILGMRLFDHGDSNGLYDWIIKYAGHGYFTIFCYDEDGEWYLCNSYSGVSVSNYCTDDSLWIVAYDSNDDYYTIKSKTANANGGYPYLGRSTSGSIQLVSSASSSRKWSVCFSENAPEEDNDREYYKYDASLLAIEDASHHFSHSDIFNFAGQSVYIRLGDIFNYSHSVSSPLSKNAVKNSLSRSKICIIRTHGGISGTLLLKPNQATGSYFYISDLPSNLSYLNIGMYIACHSASGAYTSASSNNLTYNTVENGAKCAIGFDGTVSCSDAHEFIKLFFDYYSRNYGSPYIVARDAFEYACEEATLNANYYYSPSSFKPFYDSATMYITFDVTENECSRVISINHH